MPELSPTTVCLGSSTHTSNGFYLVQAHIFHGVHQAVKLCEEGVQEVHDLCAWHSPAHCCEVLDVRTAASTSRVVGKKFLSACLPQNRAPPLGPTRYGYCWADWALDFEQSCVMLPIKQSQWQDSVPSRIRNIPCTPVWLWRSLKHRA